MIGDDGRNTPEWPIKPESARREPVGRRYEEAERTAPPARKRNINPVLLALGGLVLLLGLIWLFTGTGDGDEDKLVGNETSNTASTADPEERCASARTYDLIKRQLFRQAAQVRGSDQSAFDRLAGYAVIRMENPVLESDSSDADPVSCSGSLSLDLRPGVAVAGGRRTLAADVDYTIRKSADGSGDVVLLRNADAIITPLATLARTSQPAAQQPATPVNPVTGEPAPGAPMPPVGAPPPAPPAAPPQAPPAPEPSVSSARPSFNCANARSRGEIAVCRNSGLANLDRQMASQFFRARSEASPSQRALLDRTRGRFISYRDGCRSDDCIADAYRGRMREISDIMAGRWQPR
jgi:hypothetical protein